MVADPNELSRTEQVPLELLAYQADGSIRVAESSCQTCHLCAAPILLILPTALRFQPISESEVARRVCELVQAAPVCHVPDIGGPEVLTLGELAKTWLTLLYPTLLSPFSPT